MTRPVLAALLLITGLLIGAVVWFPASIALRALPAPTVCDRAQGTLWLGRCDRLVAHGAEVGRLEWRVDRVALWRSGPAVELRWAHRDDALSARISPRRTGLRLTDIRGQLDLGSLRASPLLPPAIAGRLASVEGRLHVDLARIEFDGARAVTVQGQIEGRSLAWRAGERWDIGGMRAQFLESSAAGPALRARIGDLGGPLELQGEFAMVAPPAWTLTGTIRARDPAWAPKLVVFGPPDAQGRHRLSVEGR